ncbi:MAG: hypothetical protein ACTHLT_05430 [Devosia sp.]
MTANDNVSFRGGHPALKWLINTDAEAGLAVQRRINQSGTETYTRPVAAIATGDDSEAAEIPDDPLTLGELVEEAQDGPDEVAIEVLHEDRPAERDLLTAIGWKEWPTTSRRSAPVGWSMRAPARQAGMSCSWAQTDGSTMRPAHDVDRTARLHGLTYYLRPGARRGKPGGMLIAFTGAGRKPQRPAFMAEKPRGGKRAHRSPAGVASYLALAGRYPSPLAVETFRRPMSGKPAIGDYYAPLPSVAEAGRLLKELGVDGSVSFENLPLGTRDTRPAKPARGARFLAGMVGSKETAKVAAPAWQEPRAPLSDVLDEVAARGTLKSIGARLGYREGYADRAGKRALLAEARAMLAANDNDRVELAA